MLSVSTDAASDRSFGQLYDLTDGALLWETTRPIVPVTATATAVVVAVGDSSLSGEYVVLDSDSWTVRRRTNRRPRLAVGDDFLTQWTADGTVSLERVQPSGKRVWRRQFDPISTDAVEPLVVHDGTVFVRVEDRVVGLSATDGVTTLSVGPFLADTRPIVTTDRRLYFGRVTSPSAGRNGVLIRAIDVREGTIRTHEFDRRGVWPVAAGNGSTGTEDETDTTWSRSAATGGGPVVQLLGNVERSVAGLTPDCSTVRWRHAGTAVATGPRGVYVRQDDELVAVGPTGTERWRVSPRLGVESFPGDSLTEWDAPHVRLNDRLVVTGPYGLVSYDVRDGSERVRVSGFDGVPFVYPWPRRNDPSLLDETVLAVDTETVYAVPV